jgi:uncharacterized delta-60 repeat protein
MRTSPALAVESLEDRFTPDAGLLDPTFGTGGKALIPLDRVPGGTDEAAAVALQSDGKIVVVGKALDGTTGSQDDIAIARLTSTGQLDTAFDGDGRKVIALDLVPNGQDLPSAVAVQSDGKILILGSVETVPGSGSDAQTFLVRLNPDGSFDNTFDGDGKLIVSVDNGSYPASLAIQTDGKIVVAGSAWPTNNSDSYFVVLRLNSDGSPDTGFATSGVYRGAFHGHAYSVALDSSGRILAAGVGDGLGKGHTDFAVVRLGSAGAPDSTFSGDGAAFVAFDVGGALEDWAHAVLPQADDKIVLVGQAEQTFGLFRMAAFAAARLNADGSLDSGFGTSGRVNLPFAPSGSSSYARGGALQPDGKIVLMGEASTTLPDFDFAAARLNANGTLDSTFAGTGTTMVPFNRGGDDIDEGFAGVRQPDGKIVIAGLSRNDGSGSGTDFAVIRLLGDPRVSFAQPFDYTVPSNGMSVAAGDFDGDGDIDTAIGTSGGVSVLINDGTGKMGSQTDLGLGSSFPRSIRVADINGDGKADILAANDLGHTISILRGNGNGTFQAPINANVGGSVNLEGFVVADFNGDSKLDVVVSRDDALAILLNFGGANILGAPTFFANGVELAIGIDSADFNGDSKADLAITEYDGNRVTVFLGNGNGTFGAGTSHDLGGGSNPAAIIARDANGLPLDLNGDGKVDLVASSVGNGFVYVFLGNGTGGFTNSGS